MGMERKEGNRNCHWNDVKKWLAVFVTEDLNCKESEKV